MRLPHSLAYMYIYILIFIYTDNSNYNNSILISPGLSHHTLTLNIYIYADVIEVLYFVICIVLFICKWVYCWVLFCAWLCIEFILWLCDYPGVTKVYVYVCVIWMFYNQLFHNAINLPIGANVYISNLARNSLITIR